MPVMSTIYSNIAIEYNLHSILSAYQEMSVYSTDIRNDFRRSHEDFTFYKTVCMLFFSTVLLLEMDGYFINDIAEFLIRRQKLSVCIVFCIRLPV